MLRDMVDTRLSLSHHVDVFQWDRECFIVWAVKLQTWFFMMSREKFSSPGPRIFCSASFFFRLLRLQRHLLAQCDLPLSMMVLEDQEVSEFRLHTEICNLDLRIPLDFESFGVNI